MADRSYRVTYTAGSNIAGYLPDEGNLAEFDTAAEAVECLVSMIRDDVATMLERASTNPDPAVKEECIVAAIECHRVASLLDGATVERAVADGKGWADVELPVDADAIAPLGRVYWVSEGGEADR